MTSFFDILPDRRNTESIKWHAYGDDVLPMWVADMDFRSPPPVVQALRERVEHGVFGYPQEIGELRQVLSHRLETLYDWKVREEEIVLIPGVVPGFNLALHALTQPGDGLVIQTPVYPPILKANLNAGLVRQDAPLVQLPDGSYAVDWDRFESAFTGQTRFFLLCNPHNPVGRVYRREELERMAQICLSKGVLICSDEIHCDLLYDNRRHIPIASLEAEISSRTITLLSPSKTFNVAGLQCAFAVIQDKALRDAYCSAREGLVSWVTAFGQLAALAAYREGQEWLDGLLEYLDGNRRFASEYIRAELPGIQMVMPEGTYLAWLDCREAGIQDEPCRFFLRQGRVALNDGRTFGPGGEGFLRLNFGCPRSMLQAALERMKTALLEEGIRE